MSTKMCNKIKESNLFSKLIGTIILVISIILVNNVYLVFALIGVSIFLSYILNNFESLQLSIILIVISMFYYAHPFLLIIVKLIMLYTLFLIVKDVTYDKEKMCFMDFVFYKNKSKLVNKIYFNTCFKTKLFNKNMNEFNDIDNYERRKYSAYIVKQAEMKTHYDLQDISYRNKLSFYKFYNKKTTILNMKWQFRDFTIIIISVLIFLFVLLCR